jgi:phage baseplate assembly protein W
MSKKQFYNIKYPFVNESNENYLLDLNDSRLAQARSEVMHLIFTPKRQRIRKPNFGTDLIKYIFDTNNSLTWAEVEKEISKSVEENLRNITIQKIDIYNDEKYPNDVFVKIIFNVDLGYTVLTDKIITSI